MRRIVAVAAFVGSLACVGGGGGGSSASAGDAPSTAPATPPAKRHEVPPWANVAKEQLEAAEKAAVPVAFENPLGMRFVLVPAGSFVMGSPPTEADRLANEEAHTVVLTKPYYLGITEVTNAQYRRFKPDHASGAYRGHDLDGDAQPAVNVSWDDAKAFAAWLTGQDRGRTYRLPTEAEWERACRAGATGRWTWGDDPDSVARYANARDRRMHARFPEFPPDHDVDDGAAVTANVGSYRPNAFGLYDVHGNVWEWCEDWLADYPRGSATDPVATSGADRRVFRGGSWFSRAKWTRCAHRAGELPRYRDGIVGCRLAVDATAR